MARKGVVSKVKEGTKYTWGGREYTVKPSCGGRGSWFCLTHKVLFTNQFQKDSHIHKGTHEMVWICIEHGPEVP
jgi:hypothetical protein